MATALVAQSDVETSLLRPLTSQEADYIDGLCDQASAKLRAALPALDDLITSERTTSEAVAAMLANVIKRVLVNPRGLWSSSHGEGPFTASETYPGVRGGDGAAFTAGLVVTADDIAALFPVSSFSPGGTVFLKPPLTSGYCW